MLKIVLKKSVLNDKMDVPPDRLHVLEEKERKRKESIFRSKQRPDYKSKVKEYNKRYYEQRKLNKFKEKLPD